MSVTPEGVGTDPQNPADAGGAGEPQATPEAGDLQAKYDTLLERLTALETGKQSAEQERDALLNRINERLEPQPLHQAQPDEMTTRMSRFEQNLLYTASNGQTEAEKDAAVALLGMFNFVRGMPGQFSEQMALAPLDGTTRAQVQAVMKEAAASGNKIAPEFARELINLRAAQAELTKMKAAPMVQPPNTRVVPSPVPVAQTGTITYAQLNAEWPTATAARKSELSALERAGKIVPG